MEASSSRHEALAGAERTSTLHHQRSWAWILSRKQDRINGISYRIRWLPHRLAESAELQCSRLERLQSTQSLIKKDIRLADDGLQLTPFVTKEMEPKSRLVYPDDGPAYTPKYIDAMEYLQNWKRMNPSEYQTVVDYQREQREQSQPVAVTNGAVETSTAPEQQPPPPPQTQVEEIQYPPTEQEVAAENLGQQQVPNAKGDGKESRAEQLKPGKFSKFSKRARSIKKAA